MNPVRDSAAPRRLRPTVALLLAVLLLVAAGGGAKTFKPPFLLGPKGGDRFNYVSANPDGQVTAIRMYPFPPGGVRCSGSAGWANLRVEHATREARSLRVSYTDAAVDPYTFISVTAKIGDDYIGAKKIRGPILGDGTVAVPLRWPAGDARRNVKVLFGLELTSACPAFDGGHVQFTKVTLSPTRLSSR